MDWLATGSYWAILAGCIGIWLVVLGLGGLLLIYFKLRGPGREREARLLSYPLPPDDQLPHVVVQIPVFNEGAIVERAIDHAVRLDWPRDRLHVQICDDSTDATTEIARAAAQEAHGTGVDVVVLHRADRTGFKAGALNAAIATTEHRYFAILDVDFEPARDFLRRCMAPLLAEPAIAFVQAKLRFSGAQENSFTRAQRIILDFHYELEQPTRCWSGQALPFNGTGGIWRRDAIEAGGGWSGDMLTEDWDMAYRALLEGWRGFYASSVEVPGELPTDVRSWKSQQRRWMTGAGEVAWKIAPAVAFQRGMSLGERVRALLPFSTWLGFLLFATSFFLALGAMALNPSLAVGISLTVLTTYGALLAMLFVVARTANRAAGRGTPLVSFIGDFGVVILLLIFISWVILRSLPGTMMGRRRVFVRTPKQGGATSPL